jgi:hypothetical protein
LSENGKCEVEVVFSSKRSAETSVKIFSLVQKLKCRTQGAWLYKHSRSEVPQLICYVLQELYVKQALQGS